MSAKFCCCLPLRLGVLLISFFQFIISLGAAGIMWYALHLSQDLQDFPQNIKISIIVFSVVYTLSSLLSLIGFIGACIKKHGFVRTFSILMQFVLGFQIGSSIYFLIAMFTNRDSYIQRCLEAANNNEATEQYCNNFKNLNKGAIIISAILPVLIQAYACYVVSAYANRLAKERTSRGTHAGSYAPVKGADTFPLHDTPFSNSAHSFGKNKGDV